MTIQKLIKLTDNQFIDVLNIITKTYHPLKGFLKEDDFNSVNSNMRLKSGKLWPIPIVLDVDSFSKSEDDIMLIDKNGIEIAKLINPEFYKFNKKDYCISVFGTYDNAHPGVKRVIEMKEYLVGGELKSFINIKKYINNNLELRDNYITPKELKNKFKAKGWKTIVAFQTRNPPHCSHEYIQKCALEHLDGLFINPVLGEKKKGDFLDEVIIGSYKILLSKYYNKDTTLLSVLPMYMKYAGPKEAILHEIIRQNMGCTHMIIGRDHAGVGNYYGPYDAHKIFNELRKKDLKINILKYDNSAFCKKCSSISSYKTCPHNESDKINISGTKLRKMFEEKENIPTEFMRKEVSEYINNFNNPFVN